MKKFFIVVAALIVAGIAALVSCNRYEMNPNQETDMVSEAENDVVSETVLQKIDNQIDDIINLLESANFDLTMLKSAQAGTCDPKITIDTPPKAKFPKTITLDFGTGCTDSEGNFRAGKIIVHITGPYWEKNSVRTAKLENYLFNDLKITGDRQESNKGTNDKGYYVFAVKCSEKITNAKTNALVVDRSWTRERIYNRGTDLKTNKDDEVWITGSAKVEKNGVNMTKEITKPLYRQLTCPHFQSGIITTYVNKVKTAELNYGEKGVCDDKATWTDGKTTKEITLKTSINYFSINK